MIRVHVFFEMYTYFHERFSLCSEFLAEPPTPLSGRVQTSGRAGIDVRWRVDRTGCVGARHQCQPIAQLALAVSAWRLRPNSPRAVAAAGADSGATGIHTAPTGKD